VDRAGPPPGPQGGVLVDPCVGALVLGQDLLGQDLRAGYIG